jgi:two-component system nitrogen regulation response regulator GlnG
MAYDSGIRIIVLSGQNRDANIQHALTLGAADFIPKPSDPQLLIARLMHQQRLIVAQSSPSSPSADRLIGSHPATQALRQQVSLYAKTPFPVLIAGESGTGKELIARALHEQSRYPERPFIPVNCAAFTPELLDAQLFGYRKGAFTGAQQDRAGFFEAAGEGTLFLDEIGEMPIEMQARLLRVLENGEFYRLGDTSPQSTAARIIAASNRDLAQQVHEQKFRQDLYHRLSVLAIFSPPLRERGDDRFELFEHFQQLFKEEVPLFKLEDPARKRLAQYPFPGNIRELKNLIIRLGTRYAGKQVTAGQLEAELDPHTQPIPVSIPDEPFIDSLAEDVTHDDFSLDSAIQQVEKHYICKAIALSKGNMSQAARLLKTSRTTLYGKMQRLGIHTDPLQESDHVS